VKVDFKMTSEELEANKDHSGILEAQIDRQWVTFAMFTSTKLAKELSAIAVGRGVTGFLSLGQPGVCCLEGGPKAIADVVAGIRKDVFASVEKQARTPFMNTM